MISVWGPISGSGGGAGFWCWRAATLISRKSHCFRVEHGAWKSLIVIHGVAAVSFTLVICARTLRCSSG
jgi:hypothetical protein